MSDAKPAGPQYVEIYLSSPHYPVSLREIVDPPESLYIWGGLTEAPGIAIVGSRECTEYGRRTAYRLAVDLVRCGFTVVSGLARGIDAAAHRGALEGGGRTVAVLPTGTDRIYPPGHVELAHQIARAGAVVTEFPPQTRVHASNFHQRNRIIAGLAAATVVVEAARKSGAKITVKYAVQYDREVMAVPGPIDSRVSQGANDLIAEGAAPCTGIDSLWRQLPESTRAAATPPGDTTERQQARKAAGLKSPAAEVFAAFGDLESCGVDRLLATTGLPIGTLLVTLTDLEVRGLVRSVGSQRYKRV
jgi:DNA processing protein